MSSILVSSQLHDEKTFYQSFLNDLDICTNEVIIESPFITSERMRTFERVFLTLLKRNVKIFIMTRDPSEHYEGMEVQSEEVIQWCESVGIQVLLSAGNHHRKYPFLIARYYGKGVLISFRKHIVEKL